MMCLAEKELGVKLERLSRWGRVKTLLHRGNCGTSMDAPPPVSNTRGGNGSEEELARLH
jgi:hypothetical protein